MVLPDDRAEERSSAEADATRGLNGADGMIKSIASWLLASISVWSLIMAMVSTIVRGIDSNQTELGAAAYLLMCFMTIGLIAGMRTKWLGDRRFRKILHKTYWAVKHALEPELLSDSDVNRNRPDKLLAFAMSSTENFASIWTSFWTRHDKCPLPIRSAEDLQDWFEFLQRRRSEKFRIRNLWLYVNSCLLEI